MKPPSLLEYGLDLVMVPRLCEVCLVHVAVYYDYSRWPDHYICRGCLEARELGRVLSHDMPRKNACLEEGSA